MGKVIFDNESHILEIFMKIINRTLLELESLRKEKRYDEIIDVINSDKCLAVNPIGLTIKGRCLQLCSRGASLKEIENCFIKAISLDPNYVDAMIELGWFYCNVKDSPDKAKYWFQEARRVVRQQVAEIKKGMASSRADVLHLAPGD